MAKRVRLVLAVTVAAAMIAASAGPASATTSVMNVTVTGSSSMQAAGVTDGIVMVG